MILNASLIFYGFAAFLDEASTFAVLSKGGVELNPNVSWMISVHPLLYSLCDLLLFSVFCALDILLRVRVRRFSLVWAVVGFERLFFSAWNIIQLLAFT
jgi:hypothetical protein